MLAEQNLSLKGEIDALTAQLEEAMSTHRAEMGDLLRKCTEL